MQRVGPVDTATLRGARAVGIVCAVAFVAPVVLSVIFPQAFLFTPYHGAYQRMLSAMLLLLSPCDLGANIKYVVDQVN